MTTTERTTLDALPAPPRPVTARARRRAWADPGVRFWWLAAAVLLAAAAYMAFVGHRAWSHQAWLSQSASVVQAKVVQASGQVFGSRAAPPDADVMLSFDWNGRPHQATGRLADRKPGEFVIVGSTVPIRVNPANPDDWTSFDRPPPPGGYFLGTMVAAPAAAAAGVLAWLARRGLLRTVRDGRGVPARVVGRQQTALAPNAVAVRCSPADAGGRVVTVYVPRTSPAARDGDELLVLTRPNGGGRAVAADWFA